MLQILFQYTQWKVALTVTIQRVSENQHRSGILSSDYSFGDEEMWTASLVVIRSECWNRLEYLRSQTLFLASLRFACLRSNCPDQLFLAIFFLSAATQVPSVVSHLTEKGQG